nr:hypothetical protein [Actinomycetales bacterium]
MTTRRAVHLRSLLSLDRRDLEFLLLLTSGWDQIDLRPRQLAARRVGVMGIGSDPELALALRIAAHAASVQLIQLDPALTSDPQQDASTLGSLFDAVVLADPDGTREAWYEQDRVRVFNLGGPSGAPFEVIGHVHTRLRHGALRGAHAVWQGEPGPALTSWVQLTGELAVRVTQVGGRRSVPHAILEQVRERGQAGSFEQVGELAQPADIDARAKLDVRTRACVIAAAFEFLLHTE